MTALPDDRYDVFVVDVTEDPESTDMVHLELAITTGAHKGEVVQIRAQGLHGDPIGVIGLPATLEVRNGAPSLTFD